MSPDTRAHVHELIDRLPPGQLAAIETLLESMIDDEELTEEDPHRQPKVALQHPRRGDVSPLIQPPKAAPSASFGYRPVTR